MVLVHGFADNGSEFRMLQKRLEKRGAKVIVPKLKHPDGRGGLEKLAEGLKQDIDKQFGPEDPIQIVAFSMGGLVSRYYLQDLDGASRCENFVTISSPHNGTLVAWLYPTEGAKQMRPNSRFLTSLRATEPGLGKMPVTSYRTPMDLIILPTDSSVWDRAENLKYPVLMHPLMLNSSPVLQDIEKRIMDSSTKKNPDRQ